MQQLIAHLAQQQHPLWKRHSALLQLGGELALLRGGAPVAHWALPASPSPPPRPSTDMPSQPWQQRHGTSALSPAPQLQHARASLATGSQVSAHEPLAGLMPCLLGVQPAVVCSMGGAGAGAGPQVQLVGQGLHCEDCKVVCRSHGRHLAVEVEPGSPCCQSGSSQQVCL